MENPKKTDGGEWISSYEWDLMMADEVFLLSKPQYAQLIGSDQGERGVIAYHLPQSFSHGEMDQATTNRYDIDMSLTKGKHAFPVCTNVYLKHAHSHIIVNSTALNYTEHALLKRLGCIYRALLAITKPTQNPPVAFA